jgi:hypothetical protein
VAVADGDANSRDQHREGVRPILRQGDFSTFASGELRGVVSPDATDDSGDDDADPAAIPALVRAPWITRKVTCRVTAANAGGRKTASSRAVRAR